MELAPRYLRPGTRTRAVLTFHPMRAQMAPGSICLRGMFLENGRELKKSSGFRRMGKAKRAHHFFS